MKPLLVTTSMLEENFSHSYTFLFHSEKSELKSIMGLSKAFARMFNG